MEMEQNKIPHKVFCECVYGTRKVRRLKLRWKMEWLGVRNWKLGSGNREKWRSMIGFDSTSGS